MTEGNVIRTARDRARAQVQAELLAAARARLATDGAAALSLRAVARDLGVASSAVYRYVPSRDALLTLLIIEAYDAAGQACEDAEAQAGDATPADRWVAVARAFRAWAVANPHSFGLVYGTPVPGYAAPQDTVPSAVRPWAVLARVIGDARRAGHLRPADPDVDVAGVLDPDVLEFARAAGGDDPSGGPPREADIVRAVALFASLLGAVTSELFGHLHRVVEDLPRGFELTVRTAAAGIGLTGASPL